MSRFVARKAIDLCFAIRAKNWSMGAKRFLKTCPEACNLDAAYIFGMVCLFSADADFVFTFMVGSMDR
jgi:hypothetical protein